MFDRGQTYLIRTVVTAGAGGVSFLLTNGVTDDLKAQLVLSVIVGGIVLSLQRLIDVESRLGQVETGFDASAERLDATVHDVLTRFGDVTVLLTRTRERGLPTEALLDTVRAVAGVWPGA